MWLLIHAEIDVNHVCEMGPRNQTSVMWTFFFQIFLLNFWNFMEMFFLCLSFLTAASGGMDSCLMVWNFKPQMRAYRFVGHKVSTSHPTSCSMALCKTAVTPLLAHWSYCSLALSHRYVTFSSCIPILIINVTISASLTQWPLEDVAVIWTV